MRSMIGPGLVVALALCGGCTTPTPPGAPALTTGTVGFSDLPPDRLAEVRVIPEEGTRLFQPENRIYAGVDGFWQRGVRGWYKIPAGFSVRVRPAAPGSSVLECDVSSRDGLPQRFMRLGGRRLAAGWVPDDGATAHPSDYPF